MNANNTEMPPISATGWSLTLCMSLPVNPAFFALLIKVKVAIAETRKTMKKSSTKWRKKKDSMVGLFLRDAFIYFLDVESLDCSSLVQVFSLIVRGFLLYLCKVISGVCCTFVYASSIPFLA